MSGIPREHITGLVLAGGRGSRMGGVDKGLQPHLGQPLAWHALQRLAPQVGTLAVNANRHLAQYAALTQALAQGLAHTLERTQPPGAPPCEVWPDTHPDQPGPLAGLATGLARCRTPWLVSVPCDTPRFPTDVVARLAQAAQAASAPLAMAATPAGPGAAPQLQPVFCLLHHSLLPSLLAYLASGRRRVDAWTTQHPQATVVFDAPGDAPDAFFNANTTADLAWLQTQPA